MIRVRDETTVRASSSAYSPESPLAPFLVFDGLFFDRVELVEANEALDVVPRGDALLVAEAGKITGRLQLFERALIEMKGDQQLKQRVERHLVTQIGELRRARHRTIV